MVVSKKNDPAFLRLICKYEKIDGKSYLKKVLDIN
jgi:hypothetical protein